MSQGVRHQKFQTLKLLSRDSNDLQSLACESFSSSVAYKCAEFLCTMLVTDSESLRSQNAELPKIFPCEQLAWRRWRSGFGPFDLCICNSHTLRMRVDILLPIPGHGDLLSTLQQIHPISPLHPPQLPRETSPRGI